MLFSEGCQNPAKYQKIRQMECYIAVNTPSLGHQNSFAEIQVPNVGHLDTPGCRAVFLFYWLFPERCSNKAGIADGSAQDLQSFFAISLYSVINSVQINKRVKKNSRERG